MMKRAYKYRLYPNDEQKILLAKHFGCMRFIYNHFLAKSSAEYKESKRRWNRFEYQSEIPAMKKSEQPWLKEVSSLSLQATLLNLDKAFKSFFDPALKARFPRFKSRRNRQSFSVPQNVKVHSGRLFIPKFKQGIKLAFHRKLTGVIRNATVSMNPSGQYFVSILCETEIKPLPKTEKSVGVDLGIKTLAVLSDGKEEPNHRTLRKYLKQLAQAQKHLSRKTKGSKRRENQRLKVARLHNKISNIRNDITHKFTTGLVQDFDIICIEDLNVKGLLKNKRLAKDIGDALWGRIRTQLTYKAEWYEKTLVIIDRFFPSSKLHFQCGHVNEITLSDRTFTCQGCNEIVYRDLNAAKNIEREGLRIFQEHCAGTAQHKRGATVRPSLLKAGCVETLKDQGSSALMPRPLAAG